MKLNEIKSLSNESNLSSKMSDSISASSLNDHKSKELKVEDSKLSSFNEASEMYKAFPNRIQSSP